MQLNLHMHFLQHCTATIVYINRACNCATFVQITTAANAFMQPALPVQVTNYGCCNWHCCWMQIPSYSADASHNSAFANASPTTNANITKGSPTATTKTKVHVCPISERLCCSCKRCNCICAAWCMCNQGRTRRVSACCFRGFTLATCSTDP